MSTWRTKDGTILEMKDMSDRYLMNCIRMLNRQETYEEIAGICPFGEEYYDEIDIQEHPRYKALEKELSNRRKRR